MKKLILMLLITFSNISVAQEAAKQWLVVTTNSYHFERDVPYNEKNWGLGWEWSRTDHVRYGVGFYQNSFYKATEYVYVAYTPWKPFGLSVGPIMGLVTGYEKNDDQPSLLEGLMLVKEWNNVGINVLANPAAIAFQLKATWW